MLTFLHVCRNIFLLFYATRFFKNTYSSLIGNATFLRFLDMCSILAPRHPFHPRPQQEFVLRIFSVLYTVEIKNIYEARFSLPIDKVFTIISDKSISQILVYFLLVLYQAGIESENLSLLSSQKCLLQYFCISCNVLTNMH